MIRNPRNPRNLNPRNPINTAYCGFENCRKSVTLPFDQRTHASSMVTFHRYIEHGILSETMQAKKKFSFRFAKLEIDPFNFNTKYIPSSEIFKTFEDLEDREKIQFAKAVNDWKLKGFALYMELKKLDYKDEVINSFTYETLRKMFELNNKRVLTAEAAQKIVSETQPQGYPTQPEGYATQSGYVPPLNVGHPLYLTPALQDASTTEDEVDVDERDAQGKHLLGPVYDALFGRATTPKSNAQQPHASPQPDNPKHYLGEIYDDL